MSAIDDRTPHDQVLTPRAELRRLVERTRQLVSLERLGGVVVLPGEPVPQPQPEPAHQPAANERPRRAHAPETTSARPRAARSAGFVPKVRPLDLPPDALAPFAELPAQVSACTRCGLAASRTRAVFGEGDPQADLVFCGEAPGYEEDQSGRPFVGAAGVLLTAMIEKGLRMRREDVFILNTLKCRPPSNRTPVPEELAACRPHLEQQLATISPRVIVALGNAAVRALLGETVPISRMRGRVVHAFGAQIVPTYHPAYLLRTPSAKRQAWEDLKRVLAILAGD